MSSWKFWDWIGYALLAISIIGGALKERGIGVDLPTTAYALTFVLGSVILLLRWFRPAPNPTVVAQSGSPAKQSPELSPRVFADTTPVKLFNLGIRQTSLQLKREYGGKWLMVRGKIEDVILESNGRTSVSLKFKREDGEPRFLFLYFEAEWHDRLTEFARDKQIAAIGRIESFSATYARLQECELMDSTAKQGQTGRSSKNPADK